MSVQEYYEALDVYEEVSTPGAFGLKRIYTLKKTIDGAIGTLSRQEKLIAESNGIKSTYVVTVNLIDKINYGTIIKRAKTGQYLRITSNADDATPPAISSFDWCQSNAEKFEMPKNHEVIV